MKTYDGFKKKNCYLKNELIIVDGKPFKLTRLENRTYLKPLLWLCALVIIIGILLIFPILSQIQNTKNNTDQIIKIFILIPAFIAALTSLYHLIQMITTYRGIWIANGNNPIYIEKVDEPNIEKRLEKIRNRITYDKLSTDNHKKTNILNTIAIIIFLISLFIILSKIIFPSTNIFYVRIQSIPLIPFVFLGFVFKILSFIKEIKWD